MSGRKSSEVASVLAQGEKVRKLTDEQYGAQIENALEKLAGSIAKGQAQQQEVATWKFNLNQAAEGMFGDEGKERQNVFLTIKQSVTNKTFPVNEIENIRSELKKLDDALVKADKEAADIRKAIKEKRNGWYCDDEYRRANELVKEYKRLRDERVSLSHRAEDLQKKSRQMLNQLTADVERLTGLKVQLENMNDMAEKRQESNAMRETLGNILNDIPVEESKKFFEHEYVQIKKDTEAAIAEADEVLIAVFQEKYNVLTSFQNELTACIARWQQQKADAEGLLKEVQELADFSLIGPVEYFNKKEKGQKTLLFDYMRAYCEQDFEPEYLHLIEKAEDFIRREEFEKSMPVLEDAAKLVRVVRDNAASLQEAMLKKTELAGAIQKVMRDMKYDVKTRIIDGNPDHGYRITCTVGDEIIDFDHIDIDNEGKVIIDIDHKEAIGGTCQSSWSEIAQHMLDAGIPVTNITVTGGDSVLRQKKVNGKTGQITQRKH